MSVAVEQMSKITSSDHDIRVQIDDVSCSIMCWDATIIRYLTQLYSGFLSDKPVDITIELDIVERFNASDIESAEPPAKKLMWGDQIAAICRIDEETSTPVSPAVKVTVEKRQFEPRLGFKIMNLLLAAFYCMVLRVKYQENFPAMLVHACGILRKGKLMIFTGLSGTGKTTVARLCGNEHGQVVNDEMLLVTGAGIDGAGLMTQGIPVIGEVAQRLNIKAPPACVIMLKQAQKTSIRKLDRVEAYRRFLRQVILTQNLIGPDDNKAIFTEIARFSDLMTKAVPFYELEFTLEKEPLWQAVGKIEESLMKGQIAQ